MEMHKIDFSNEVFGTEVSKSMFYLLSKEPAPHRLLTCSLVKPKKEETWLRFPVDCDFYTVFLVQHI
jgi:hypothetical protein